MKPLVSVCLPVYNAAPYLQDCLDSIASQTLKPLELIAVDDCSTDGSYKILEKFAKTHHWVRLFKMKVNSGVSPTFNFAVSQASSNFIARMDADDIMIPDRLEKQVNFLIQNPHVVIVGGQCHLINKRGEPIGDKTFPLHHRQIYDMLFQTVPMQQPTITINRRLLPPHFLYGNKAFSPAEDYGLFFSALKYGQLANLPDFIHFYREHQTNISLIRPKFTFWRIWRARLDGVFHHGYAPAFSAILIVLLQTLAVLLLPEKLIYPLHKLTRHMDKKST